MEKKDKAIICCILCTLHDLIQCGRATVEEVSHIIPEKMVRGEMFFELTDEEIKEEAKKMLFSY